MSYSREQWARDFLAAIGNANPSQNVVNWVVAWEKSETSCCTGASFNQLNTTLKTSDSVGTWNSIGVQQYKSYSGGIQANAQTLMNGRYASLLGALRSNDEQALGYGSTSPSPNVMQNLNTWCGSCGYGNSFVKLGGAGKSEIFSGTPTSVTPLSTGNCNPILQNLFPYLPCDAITIADNKIASTPPSDAATQVVGGLVNDSITNAINGLITGLTGDFMKVGLFLLSIIVFIIGFIVIGRATNK